MLADPAQAICREERSITLLEVYNDVSKLTLIRHVFQDTVLSCDWSLPFYRILIKR